MEEQVSTDTSKAPSSFKKSDFKDPAAFAKTIDAWKKLQTRASSLHDDSIIFSKDLEVLKKENETLKTNLQNLNTELSICRDNQMEWWQSLFTPPGCLVTIVLIVAVTILGIKKGFVFSKGTTTFSTGDGKKKGK